ncbi:MAG TPA: hypothetical protein VEA79_07205 [Phenylobacterium sp.]|nr:hypothetical protein [Phenylobacterium sp.]
MTPAAELRQDAEASRRRAAEHSSIAMSEALRALASEYDRDAARLEAIERIDAARERWMLGLTERTAPPRWASRPRT